VRDFTAEPVPDSVVASLLDVARFAPNGGNRQAWRVIVVKDPAVRKGLRDLYQEPWQQYLAMMMAGLTPWSPLNDRGAEAAAIAGASKVSVGFADHFDEVPVLLVLLADLRRLACVDRDLPRYTMVGGASIYPFAWSILLAARSVGLGGVITTMTTGREADMRALLGVPEEFAVAGVLALGRPVHQATRLKREPVSSFATVDRLDGPAFS
jgi:nitroreductase